MESRSRIGRTCRPRPRIGTLHHRTAYNAPLRHTPLLFVAPRVPNVLKRRSVTQLTLPLLSPILQPRHLATRVDLWHEWTVTCSIGQVAVNPSYYWSSLLLVLSDAKKNFQLALAFLFSDILAIPAFRSWRFYCCSLDLYYSPLVAYLDGLLNSLLGKRGPSSSRFIPTVYTQNNRYV